MTTFAYTNFYHRRIVAIEAASTALANRRFAIGTGKDWFRSLSSTVDTEPTIMTCRRLGAHDRLAAAATNHLFHNVSVVLTEFGAV